MLTKTKLALAAAMVFGVASAAMAESGEESGGYQVQNWQQVQHMNQANATFSGSPAAAVTPSHKPASHVKPQRQDD